jgi:membrane glycosyltransferase
MSLAMTLFSLIAAWFAIAFAMLWGVLRIARRHQPHVKAEPEKPRAQRFTTALPALKH